MGPLLAALLALVLGLALTGLGYRIFLVMLPIWGFFAGMWLGASIVQQVFPSEGFFVSVLGVSAGIILGLAMAVLSYLFYFIGVAIVAGAAGWALGAGIMGAMGFQPGLITGAAGLVMAISFIAVTLLLNIQKYVIIAITAIAGANLLVLAPLLLLGKVQTTTIARAGNIVQPVLQDSWFWALVWLAIAALGFFIQVRTTSTFAFSRDQYVENWG